MGLMATNDGSAGAIVGLAMDDVCQLLMSVKRLAADSKMNTDGTAASSDQERSEYYLSYYDEKIQITVKCWRIFK